MKTLAIVAFSVAVSACVSGYNPTYYYNEIQVVNLSGDAISNVQVNVENSRSLSCDQVARNALCDERFGKRRYPQQAVKLSWTHGDGSQKSQQVAPHIAAYHYSAFPLRLMLEIDADGGVKPYFEQETPSGHFING